MRTFKLNRPITRDDFFNRYSLTKLPKGVRYVKQEGSKRNNSIPKYIAFDKNGYMFGWGGKSLRETKKDALYRLNEDYFYAHMMDGKGFYKKCTYIKSLYNK